VQLRLASRTLPPVASLVRPIVRSPSRSPRGSVGTFRFRSSAAAGAVPVLIGNRRDPGHSDGSADRPWASTRDATIGLPVTYGPAGRLLYRALSPAAPAERSVRAKLWRNGLPGRVVDQVCLQTSSTFPAASPKQRRRRCVVRSTDAGGVN